MVSRLPEQFTVTPALSQPFLKGSGEGLGPVLSVVLTPDLSFLWDLTRTCWPRHVTAPGDVETILTGRTSDTMGAHPLL